MSKKIKFTGIIKGSEVGLGGAYVLFPYDVMETFGTKGRVPVKASIEGEAYRGSLFRYGQPQHMFPLLKAIREKLGKSIGDTIEVTLELDQEARTIDVPDDLKKALKAEKLDKVFDKLSYTHQKEYVKWIEEAKKPETRANRIVKTMAMLAEKNSK